MSKKQQKTPVCRTIEVKDLAHYEAEWLPEVLTGDAFEALKRSIEQHGQRQPILAGTTSRKIYDGRSRYAACKSIGKDPDIEWIEDSDGPAAARAGMVKRDMTVLDEARLIRGMFQELTRDEQGKSRQILADKIKTEFGWKRRCGERSIQKLLTIGRKLSDLNKDQMDILRHAATVNEAHVKIFPKTSVAAYKPSLKTIRERVAEVRDDEPDTAVRFVAWLKTELKTTARAA